MQRQHTGRAGTTVIPADWDHAPAAVIDRTHPSTVAIGPTGGQRKWNEGRGQSETVGPEPVYAGRATIMLASADQAATVVEQDTSVAVYEVKIAYAGSADVAVGHTVTVGADDPDPALAGQTLFVASVERGSRRFSRVLLATFTPSPTA